MFSNYLKPRTSFKRMFKKADKFDFYSTDHYSYTLKACTKLNKNPNIVIVQTCFNLENYIPDLYAGKDIKFNDSPGGYYNESMEVIDDFIELFISECMAQGKLIIILCDFENYSIDIENNNEGDHHSTCLIFHPIDHNNYDAFYINPHGHGSLEDIIYDVRITRRRTKRYTFNSAIDLIFIDSFIRYMQHFQKSVNIFYDSSIAHNYLGSNLQIGDNYGVCFAFPLIITLHTINCYEQKSEYTVSTGGVYIERKINLPSVKEMLDDNNLTLFVAICFIDLNEHLKDVVIRSLIPPYMQGYYKKEYEMDKEEKEEIRQKIAECCEINSKTMDFIADYEKTIEEEGNGFIKLMTNALISCLTHKDIRKIIKNENML